MAVFTPSVFSLPPLFDYIFVKLVWNLRALFKASIFSPLRLVSFLGVSLRGVGERAVRPLSRLPDRQQPDPNRAPDNRHGGDGGVIISRRAATESLIDE